MWIRRREYTALLTQIAELREQKAVAETKADWLRVRVNQLELETAQLKADATGSPQIVPQITKNPNGVDDYSSAVLEFEDVGDSRAEQLGIGWDDDGRVKYRN